MNEDLAKALAGIAPLAKDTDVLEYLLRGAIRNLDGRCATCAALLADGQGYAAGYNAPGESTATYELIICAECARWVETKLLKERRATP